MKVLVMWWWGRRCLTCRLLNLPLTLMLVVANLANTKWCQKPEKWLKPWQMGTHLRVLGESFPMNTNLTMSRWFSTLFACILPQTKVASALEGLIYSCHPHLSGYQQPIKLPLDQVTHKEISGSSSFFLGKQSVSGVERSCLRGIIATMWVENIGHWIHIALKGLSRLSVCLFVLLTAASVLWFRVRTGYPIDTSQECTQQDLTTRNVTHQIEIYLG